MREKKRPREILETRSTRKEYVRLTTRISRGHLFVSRFFFWLSERGLLVVYIHWIIFNRCNEKNCAIDISSHRYFNQICHAEKYCHLCILCRLAKIFMWVLGCWSCVDYKTSSSSSRDETVIDFVDCHEPLYRVFFNTYLWYFLQCGTYSELLANSGAFAEFLQTYASENHSSNAPGNTRCQTGHKEGGVGDFKKNSCKHACTKQKIMHTTIAGKKNCARIVLPPSE